MKSRLHIPSAVLGTLSVLLSIALLLEPIAVSAQAGGASRGKSGTERGRRQGRATQFDPGTEGFQDAGVEIASISRAAFDAVIRNGAYIVGPGDAFTLVVDTENGPEIREVLVGAEGQLVLPYIGSVAVAGLSLAEARARIEASIDKRFQHIDVQFTLSRLRSFPVNVIGEVEYPGAYLVQGVEQVSEMILEAGGLLNEGSSTASLRNIRVRRRAPDGSVSSLRADLLLWNLTGDLNHDPFLLDGDQIFVPVRGDSISISGDVHRPGNYEYAPGDRVSNLLSLARGLVADPRVSNGELLRINGQAGSEARIVLDLSRALEGDADADLSLEPGDKIYITGERPRVTIEGEVLFPGAYPVAEGTTLRALIEQAGGFTDNASLSQASVIRQVEYGADGTTDIKLTRLLTQPPNQVSDADRAYITMKTQQVPGRLPVDFAALFERGDGQNDIVLKGGDVIRIPRLMPTVLVNGSVVSPAAIPYDSTYAVRNYITRAGGFTDNANRGKVYVIQGATGNSVEASKVARVSPGDAIFVPARTPRDRWRIFRETLTVVSQIATIVLIIDTVRGR